MLEKNMIDKLLELGEKYGALGLILIACFWYILYKDKSHQSERKEITEALKKQHEEALQVTKNNTTVLTEIATLIRDRKN
jgi:hypothetical protein